MTLWACLVLLLLLASPDGAEAAKKKKKKKKSSSTSTSTTTTADENEKSGGGSTTVKKKARRSRREVDLDDLGAPAADAAGAGGGKEEGGDAVEDDVAALIREPLPEIREDALVFHSESVPESAWSWRAAKRHGVVGSWSRAFHTTSFIKPPLHAFFFHGLHHHHRPTVYTPTCAACMFIPHKKSIKKT